MSWNRHGSPTEERTAGFQKRVRKLVRRSGMALEESGDVHAVRVIEVLFERVEQLEERVNGDGPVDQIALAPTLIQGEGI